MLRPLIALSFVSVATAAAAQPVAIPGSAIKETVSGTLVELDTPAGTKIPVRFGGDGLMSGEAGDLASFLGASKDRGRWWVDGDKLCTKWFRWFDAEPHCVYLERDGARIFWREDNGEKGTGTITQQAVQVADKKPLVEAGRMPLAEAPIAAASDTAAAAPVEVAENVALTTADGSAIAEAAVPAVATPAELPPPTFSLGGGNIAEEEAIKEEAIRNHVPVTAEAPQTAPAAAAPAPAAVTSVQPAAAEAASPAKTVAKSEIAIADPAKLSFASAAALSAAMPPPANLENIFDPRHRKIKPGVAASQPAQTAATTAQPAPVDIPRASEPPANELRTAAIPSRDQRAAQPAQRALALPTYRVAGVQDDDTLNVRSGPSQYHPQVAAIPPRGRGVEITGPCRDLWCPIRRGRVSGWVNSYYLAADAPGPTASSRAYGAPGQ